MVNVCPYHRLTLKSKLVRPWPYPYLGGLSLSNDAEYMSFEFFEELMAFLNGTGETKLGKGLGLPVSSSVFFYSEHPYNFSYFEGKSVDSPRSKAAEAIEAYIRSGLIDTIHAYGDFDVYGGFTRQHAEKYFETLDKNNLRIPIFTNHGGVENIQNIGCDASYHQGDLESSLAYHSDLMLQNGVEYVWTDSLTTYDFDYAIKPKLNLKSSIRESIYKFFYWNKLRVLQKPLLENMTLQDGQSIKAFWRFRSTGQNAPNLSSLGHQIDQIDWFRFYSNNACLIIYQHLGVLNRVGGQCHGAEVDQILKSPHVYLRGLYALKEQYSSGRLWIETLYKFLKYVDLVQSIDIIVDLNGDYNIISDLDIEDPQSYFLNLTLYVDTSKPVRVCYKGKPLNCRLNGPDHTLQYSFTVTH